MFPKEILKALPKWYPTEMFRPDEVVTDPSEINFEKLHFDHGICHFASDLDRSLAKKGSIEVPTPISENILEAKSNGCIDQMAIITNLIVGNQNREIRVIVIADHFNAHRILAYAGNSKAGPGPYEQARILMELGCGRKVYPSEIAYLDDQLTNILWANLAGFYTILTKPLPGKDNLFTIPRRALEKIRLHELDISF